MSRGIRCRPRWRFLFIAVLTVRTAGAAEAGRYDVRDFGAVGNGETLCTEAIQSAIAECVADGGGTVYFPPGRYLTGTVYLESHVSLELETGSTLLGSRNREDYARTHQPSGSGEPYSIWALVAARGAKNIAICGRGTIDGQGAAFRDKDQPRPRGIYFIRCRDVIVEGVKLRSAGSWMQHYDLCERVAIRGVTVFNHVTFNNDGLNIDSCRDVRITDCVVDSDDDAIVLKSRSLQPCENVTITNCVVSSHCNAIKMGTESGGGFRNITVSNCAVQSPRTTKRIYGRDRGLAGLALEIVDGGEMNRIVINNIAIRGVTVPIFIRLGNRARIYGEGDSKPDIGTLRNVAISNVVATDCSSVGCSITGLPGHPVREVILSQIRLEFEGGGTREQASREVPEKPASYPESTMFGDLPAWGFYCRHVEGLTFDQVSLVTTAPDLRHVLVMEDVTGAALEGLAAESTPGAAALVRLTDVREAMICDSRPVVEDGTFVLLDGAETAGVALIGNDLRRVGQVLEVAEGIRRNAVILTGNINSEN